MAAQRVDPLRYTLHTCIAECRRCVADTFAEITHRVIATGDKEHRQVLIHSCQILRLLDVQDPRQHIPCKTGTGSKAAQVIRNIRVDRLFIPAQPVICRSGVFHPVVVAAEHNLLQGFTGMTRTLQFADHITHGLTGLQHRSGHPARTADHGTGDTGVRIFFQDGAYHKGSHGVTEEDVRCIGVFLFRHLQQVIGIRHSRKPTAGKTPLCTGKHGLAVAHMVLGNHRNAHGVKIIGKMVIPFHILGNSMDDLYHRFGFPVRQPAAVMDLSLAAGVKIMVRSHSANLIRPRSRHPR